MLRKSALLVHCLVVWSCLALLPCAPAAQAFTAYQLDAYTTQAYLVSDFSVQYIDKDGDSKLGLNDYVFYFSGLTFNGVQYPELVTIPKYSTASPYTNGNASDYFWAFNPASGATEHLDPVLWTYAQTAQYITYDLTALTKEPGTVSNFMVQYVDKDRDGRVGPDDLVFAFSGVTINGEEYANLTAIPRYSATESPYTNGPESVFAWQFQSSTGDTQNFVEWAFTYEQTPLPSSVLLLGTGLLPLAWAWGKKSK